MKFGRYGKDGKVTHKTSGDNLVKVGKDDEPTDDKPAKKPDDPKKDTGKVKEVEDPKVKSKKFLQSLEAGKVEDENGVVELDFDDEQSFEAAAEKARSMGLDDLADDIDSVGGYVMEMEPEKAQAEYQDMMSKYSGKPVKALEFSKKADEAISMMSDQTYAYDAAPFADDLSSTLSIMKQMVDSDETEGNVGSGMSNPMKGFRPEVIDTLQSVTDIMDHAAQLEDETDNKKVQDILAQMQGELDFISDENADHDNYTKSSKVNGSIDSMIDLNKQLQKELKKENKGVPKEPKVPSQNEMQKDLEGMVTDGMIDVEVDGDTISMSKEYEPSQEREAEQDAKAIRDYLRKKGIKVKKDDVEVEKDDEYIQINVNKNINEEMAKDKAYAIGMATAKKKYNDEPPLEKKTIKKGHEIADKLMGMKKEETIKEFKKMTVTFKTMDKMAKASTDLAKHGFTIHAKGLVMKVDGKGDDLNKYATDLKNFYGATVKAEENAPTLSDLERMKKQGLKPKKEETQHDLAKMKFEQIAGLKKKAEKSGMPYSILKKVYDRGMAAWRGGHRPGASQQQWAFARVNSFVTKSSGTWGGADKDLAKQVRGK